MPVFQNPMANLIENPLTNGKDMEEHQSNDSEGAINDEVDLLLEDFDKAQFRNEYAKKVWPYRLLKYVNWFLLLGIGIANCACAAYPLRWSRDLCQQEFAFSTPAYDKIAGVSGAAGGILFALTSISILANYCTARKCNNGKTTFWVAFFALMDQCIWAFAVPIMLISAVRFALLSISNYACFWHRVMGNYKIAKQLEPEMGFSSRHFFEADWIQHGTVNPLQFQLRFIADPLIALLSALAIPVNIALLVLVRKMIKRANIFSASSMADEEHCSSQFEREYTQRFPYGMLNTSKWLLPLLILLVITYLFFPWNYYSGSFNWSTIALFPISMAHFVLWLFYKCVVHLPAQRQRQSAHQLLLVFLADAILALCTMFAFFYFASIQRYEWSSSCCTLPFYIHYPLVALYIGSFGASFCLFWRTLFDRKFLKDLPLISVQINVQVIKKEKPKSVAAETATIKEEEGEVKANAENEEKNGKQTEGEPKIGN